MIHPNQALEASKEPSRAYFFAPKRGEEIIPLIDYPVKLLVKRLLQADHNQIVELLRPVKGEDAMSVLNVYKIAKNSLIFRRRGAGIYRPDETVEVMDADFSNINRAFHEVERAELRLQDEGVREGVPLEEAS